jgi:hypothetical protein
MFKNEQPWKKNEVCALKDSNIVALHFDVD